MLTSATQDYEVFMSQHATGANPLVWMDLEMSGLDPNRHVILEMATLITDGNLRLLAEGPHLTIGQPLDRLESMDPWCVDQHTQSGLLNRVHASSTTQAEAEQATLDFLKQHVTHKPPILCGNSIYVDRMFLRQHMPQLERVFHYRLIDVSSIKELAKRWAPDVYNAQEKRKQTASHLAHEDVKDSLRELRYYRTHFFHTPPHDL